MAKRTRVELPQVMTMDLTKWQTQFEELLEEEGLSDPRQFLEPLDEFDEVPLYTRIARIAFLDGLTADERNMILFAYALEYADKVVQIAASHLAEESLPDFFLMVTLLDWDEYNEAAAITPCFWSSRRAKEELPSMRVAVPYSAEARRVEAWLQRLGQHERYLVADYPSPPDDYALMRVHVGHRQLPRPEMPALADLLVSG